MDAMPKEGRKIDQELRHVYSIRYNVNICNLLPSVGKVIDELNDMMQSFGFHDVIGIDDRQLQVFQVTTCRPLLDPEIETLRNVLAEHPFPPSVASCMDTTKPIIFYTGTELRDENKTGNH